MWDPREDLVRTARRGSIFAVADGVSSTEAGNEAAQTTIECMEEFFSATGPPSDTLILDLIERADAEVRLTTNSACTLAGVWLNRGVATTFSVGDSCVYMCRDGAIKRLTPETRGTALRTFVGMGTGVRPSVYLGTIPFQDGDVFLIGSDGIFNAVPPGDMAVLANSPDALLPAVTTRLVDHGHDDDATLVYVRVLGVEADPQQERVMRDA
ncbi:MAG: SpoIIE family protein phosphatase [Proteobacteria bacterium]|nr:SpoIIE family protein phosphatase [Pseudomonadota bacterium]MCP4919930.1 SpoIIE family protein phosphatase [Pseudomonadota bacterium]